MNIITAAPEASALIAIAAFFIAWVIFRYRHDLQLDHIPILERQLAAKDDELKRQLATKDDELKRKDYELKKKDAELKRKDEQLKEKEIQLSQRPTHHPPPLPSPSAFAQLSNAELQRRSLTIVQQFHHLLERLEREEQQHPPPLFPHPPDTSEEETQTRWRQYTQRAGQVLSRFLSEYNRQFKADMTLLRDELRVRLRVKDEGTDLSPIDRQYENPVNTIGMKRVVADFERLAKSLPIE